MKQAAEYRKLAEECRALAKAAQTRLEREQILAMADTWEQLAKVRETKRQQN